jgi:hypothetical protein
MGVGFWSVRSRASYQTRAGAPASPGIRVKSDGPECPSQTGCAIPRSAIRETTILQRAFSGLKPAKTICGYGTTEVVRFADSSGCDLCGNAGRRRGACSAWIGKTESKSKPRTDRGVRLTRAVPHSSSATHEPSPQWHSTRFASPDASAATLEAAATKAGNDSGGWL